jgi:hypothetical protein
MWDRLHLKTNKKLSSLIKGTRVSFSRGSTQIGINPLESLNAANANPYWFRLELMGGFQSSMLKKSYSQWIPLSVNWA